MARESRYALRLPPELHEQLKTEAETSAISMNELIVRILSAHFGPKDELEQRIGKVERGLERTQTVVGRILDVDIVTLIDEDDLNSENLLRHIGEVLNRRYGQPPTPPATP